MPDTPTSSSLLDKLIRLALENRLVVVIAMVLVLAVGTVTAMKMPVDVLPDLTAPTVTILTEAKGMAPEEVETLLTYPIESNLNGATGVRRVRSVSMPGLSTVWVEFTWGTDIYRARQVVNEKLQLVSGSLPAGTVPTLAPISSIMGEIMYLAVASDSHSLMEVKEQAEFVVRKRLMATTGVAQVVTVGGETKQYQVEIDPLRLQAFGVTVGQVTGALKGSNENFAAGVIKQQHQDYLVRGMGRFRSVADIEQTVVQSKDGLPVLVRDVATVTTRAAFRVGDASANGKPAVVISVQKHPDANTLELTGRIKQQLADIQKTLPPGMRIESDLFQQADFITRAIANIKRVLLEGALLVVVILFLFLGNLRTTMISLVAMPVSLLCGIFALKLFGGSINTMTLGGMAIAIGVIVDDAIIDVENVYRRLRENAALPEGERRPARLVIFEASREIRSSIVNATLIILVVFLPLFFLSGVEGRLLQPLGISYMVSIGASLLVALTVTPALCSYLLSKSGYLAEHGDSRTMLWLLSRYRPLLEQLLNHPRRVMAGAAITFVLALGLLFLTGRSFLPAFNEGALTVMVVTGPGTSLEKSSEIASKIETLMLTHPAVKKTSRRTGRGEQDEHGKFPNASEIEVSLDMDGRRLGTVMSELRALTAVIPGVSITFGQPIGHRIDHMLSGTMANLAIKIYGPELSLLKQAADQIKAEIEGIPGLADLSVDQQADIPQLRIIPRREELARYNLTMAGVAEGMEVATAGQVVSRTLEGDRGFDVVVRFPASAGRDTAAIGQILLDTPTGRKVPLAAVADIVSGKGPNSISRENVQRKVVVQANTAGRDLRAVYQDVRNRIDTLTLPPGYFVEYGGQFESEAGATRTIGLLSIVSISLILLILYLEFRSFRAASLVMVNLPLAFIGGIVAVVLTDRVISVASLVGFITLFGIATRNGILLVSHYRYLMETEGLALREAVVKGSLERLRPVTMTALAAGLALVPFAIAAHKPGNEILSPLAVVILGGLVSATILNMLVLPVLYLRFGAQHSNLSLGLESEKEQ
ncbi:efflux RND transporter permease subunit [Trichlorobacter ammonificans]|uniref:Cobalt-zinc-cadmium resistance protein CzcA Cation efflux system protein CusA n=1 Tax=Trichlorobacter ammonificans TaxID=2916410 RepID=A0ABM9D790_9BACT|nr:efflux RND transporter permease subunit [Trichlorobacter ammonificans]CAH2030258.1 Cobalt-zinc-cadmium resistance protein CzcA; Cation efflux system protein CusA [Trichlorobacter ammonificans]